jgi:hypothetical protein
MQQVAQIGYDDLAIPKGALTKDLGWDGIKKR